jgi:SAM-dependent methyltransferase
MHSAVMSWLLEVKGRFPSMFEGTSVLECGSFDINGSPRVLFTDCDYTGVDCRPGPGVDVVGLVHEFAPGRQYDVVISTEMLEHDAHWQASLATMADLVKPGGLLALTFAGPGRRPHEIGVGSAPGYYANLTADEVVACILEAGVWASIEAYEGPEDVYILGIRPLADTSTAEGANGMLEEGQAHSAGHGGHARRAQARPVEPGDGAGARDGRRGDGVLDAGAGGDAAVAVGVL